jgi:hypothetical protein
MKKILFLILVIMSSNCFAQKLKGQLKQKSIISKKSNSKRTSTDRELCIINEKGEKIVYLIPCDTIKIKAYSDYSLLNEKGESTTYQAPIDLWICNCPEFSIGRIVKK